jgi:pyruvate dehydrogenase E2 component (dihydrolipoamide acetyltransferase)
MAKVVIMPRQGQSVESCVITAWHKKVGDPVAAGDKLFSYETDKSAFDEVADTDGTLLAVFAGEGDDVECLRDVCVIGAPGEDYSALLQNNGSAASAEAVPAAKAEPAAAAEPETATAKAEPVSAGASETASADNAGGRVKISPRAKNLAIKTNADLYAAVPTGPNGRIIERDVNALLDAGKTAAAETVAAFLAGRPAAVAAVSAVAAPAASTAETAPAAAAPAAPAAETPAAAPDGEYTAEKLPNIRKIIAKAMHASLSESAQLTLNASFDATAILAYREKVKSDGEALGLPNITINDMVLYAVSRVLPKHPDINANLVGDEMRRYSTVNLGVAVDTERGLIVPKIFGAEKLTLAEISRRIKSLAAEARSGKISPDFLKNGTFTVTNLGAFGVESFTPVINLPETAILGVDCAVNRVRDDGSVYKAMGLSLTFDHRAVDGAPAARFLKDVCDALERFDLLLAQ